MENHDKKDSLYNENSNISALGRKLLPEPDSSWRVEEKTLGGDWIFYNFEFISNNFPAAICRIPHPNAVHAISYYAENGRLMRYELWLTYTYDKEYKKPVYEAVYTYGSKTAEVEYFDYTINEPITSTLALDENGLLVKDQVITLMSYDLPFGHAIVAKYAPDPSWKRIEDYWTYKDEKQKSLGITFLGESNEFRRFERWLCDTDGNPYMLMREEHVEIKENGERAVYHNRGGYLVDYYADAVYLSPEGKEIPPKKSKRSIWVIIAIILACAVAIVGFITSQDNTASEEVVIRETVMPTIGEEGTFIPKTEIPIRYDSEFEISLESISFTASSTIINWKAIVRSEGVNTLIIDPSDYKMLVIKAKGDTGKKVSVDKVFVGSQAITTRTTIPITDKEFSFTTSYPALLGYMYINFPNSLLYSNNAIKVTK